MSVYTRFLIASLKPLMAVCVLLAIVSGAALINEGHWQTLRLGFTFMLLSKWVLPYSLLPGAILMGIMKFFEQAKPKLSFSIYMLCLVYFTTLFTGTAFLLFLPVEDLVDGHLGLAAMGWAIATAIFPWGVIALYDRTNAIFIELLLILALSMVTMTVVKFHDHGIENGSLFFVGWAQMALIVIGKAMWEHFKKPATPISA